MPTISVFFRKADLETWKRIPNKSQWLHDALASTNARCDNRYPAVAFDLDKQTHFQELRQEIGAPLEPGMEVSLNEPHYTPPEEVL